MKSVITKLVGRAGDLIDVQPVIALFLGGALLAVFLTVTFKNRSLPEPDGKSSAFWLLYQQLSRFISATVLIGFLLAAMSLIRVYLHQTLAAFQHSHGRVTEANYNAVQSIWGAEQDQGELRA